MGRYVHVCYTRLERWWSRDDHLFILHHLGWIRKLTSATTNDFLLLSESSLFFSDSFKTTTSHLHCSRSEYRNHHNNAEFFSICIHPAKYPKIIIFPNYDASGVLVVEAEASYYNLTNWIAERERESGTSGGKMIIEIIRRKVNSLHV